MMVMTSSSSTTLRPLIADDQPDVLEALRLLLKGEGYQPEAVTSPAAIIEALRSKNYDVLLMDLNYARDTTSGQEGLDLLAKIQDIDSTLPVVVMTAWGTVELAVEAMRRGVRDFVLKPWENERLLTILRTQIERGRALRKEQHLEEQKELLSSRMLDAPNLQVLLKLIADHLHQAVACRSVVVFSRMSLDQSFWPTAKAGEATESTGKLKLDGDSKLLDLSEALFDLSQADLSAGDREKISRLKCELILPIKLKGELIGLICIGSKSTDEQYDEEERRFLAAVSDRISAGINNLRLRGQDREMIEARQIQRGLLPKSIPQMRGCDIFCDWQPAFELGGDYFDVLKFSDSLVALCIADVCGKGMPAALLMSNLQAAVKAFASEATEPRELCEKINRVICNNTNEDKFITFFYCLHDVAAKRLFYANAGHNAPVLLRRDGSYALLQEGGGVLGVIPDWGYEQGAVEFKDGDKVVLFTDGVTEARNSEGEEFGEDRLIDLLVENRELSAAEMQKKVMKVVADFSNGDFQDDATLIVMSANPM